jgi:hypothetical protein
MLLVRIGLCLAGSGLALMVATLMVGLALVTFGVDPPPEPPALFLRFLGGSIMIMMPGVLLIIGGLVWAVIND